jgi:hypothetical protein
MSNNKQQDKFKYQYGFMTLSRPELSKKLNELGSEGWDIISTPRELFETDELDSEGTVRMRWEIFMKQKIFGGNNEQQ